MTQNLNVLLRESGDKCPHCGRPLMVMSLDMLGADLRFRPACRCVLEAQEAREARNRMENMMSKLRERGMEAPAYAGMTLENWEPRNTGCDQAYRTALSFVHSARIGAKNWLYFHGSNGLGKTHLAVALTRQLALEREWTPGVLRWSEYCSRIQQGWNDAQTEGEGKLWRNMTQCQVLVLDDIDKKTTSEWALGKLFDLVDYRQVYRLPTLITANRSLKDLSTLWGKGSEQVRDLSRAIISRIVGQLTQVVHMEGNDYRWFGGKE